MLKVYILNFNRLECEEQIAGFKGAVYKKFSTHEEAKLFVQERGSFVIDKRKNKNQTILLPPISGISTVNAIANESETSGVKRKSGANASALQPKKTKLIDASHDRCGKFEVNEDGFLVIYTDGSCQFNGKKGAQAGIGVYFGPNHPMNVSEPVNGKATNNRAEIQAATFAAKLAKSAGFDKVIVNTDSQFMINCMTSWLPTWKKNNWKKRDGSEVINKDDLLDLDKATDGLLIKWNHVKAHDGIEGNEVADRLAKAGAKRYSESASKEI